MGFAEIDGYWAIGIDTSGGPVKNIKDFYLISKKLRSTILQKDFLIRCKIHGGFPKKIFDFNKRVNFDVKNKEIKKN